MQRARSNKKKNKRNDPVGGTPAKGSLHTEVLDTMKIPEPVE